VVGAKYTTPSVVTYDRTDPSAKCRAFLNVERLEPVQKNPLIQGAPCGGGSVQRIPPEVAALVH
jgi:hypothetical protein